MSGAHCAEQKLEGVWCHSLHAPSIPTLLQEYQHLLQRLLGPRAGTMLVHHSGGLDTFINSSRELVKRVQPHHPCIKFINCLMEAQNSAYGCLGLYVGVLCSSLLKELLLIMDSCDEGLSHRAVKEATNLLMARAIAYLDTKPGNLVNKLDLSNLDQMLALVGTTLGSKNLGLIDEEKKHLKVKIVEAFLAIIPSADAKGLDAFGDVMVTVVEGRPATEARVFEGVLYRESDPNVRLIEAIKHRMMSSHLNLTGCRFFTSTNGLNSKEFLLKDGPLRNGNQNQLFQNENNSRFTNTIKPLSNAFGSPNSPRVSNRLAFSKYSRNISDHESDLCTTPETFQQPSCMRVVLFNVPLVFEQSESECLKFTDGASNSEVYDTVMVAKLRELARRCSVDVIACQKVVSDVIKFELQRDGVLVVERLGTALTNSLQRLTGCVTISDVAGFLPPLEEIDLGSNNTANGEGNAQTIKPNTGGVGTFCNGFVGSLTNISVVEVSGKTYLQLENGQQRTKPDFVTGQATKRFTDQGAAVKEASVVTFLLPALSSVTADSLKAVVEESLRVLRHAALHPLAAAAGGCFEAALARWITTHGVITTEEIIAEGTTTNGVITDHGVTTAEEIITLSPTKVVHASSSSDNKCEDVTAVMSLDEVLAAVDSLLLDQDAEDALSERQLRPVARVFAKVFANLSVLQSGGSSASSFDFSIDTRTSHLFPDFPSNMSSYVSSNESSTGHNSSLVRCSCRSAVPRSSGNSNKPHFVDLRSLFELQSGLSHGPHLPNTNAESENAKSFIAGNVSELIVSSSIDTMNSMDDHGDPILPSYVYDVTADVLVESYHAKVNAVRLAFEGVVQLLGVDYCVFDR